MSHPEQVGFFAAVAAANADVLPSASVLEIGAYDVNGTVRNVLGPVARYVGMDLVAGPGVDRVGYGHEADDPDGAFDLTISGECFEHDPYWVRTLTTMIRVTRPGGLVAFTCASRGRPEHGTRRTLRSDSPGTQAEGLDYYRNLDEADVRREIDVDVAFSSYQFWYIPTSFDLYFAGVRSGVAPRPAGAYMLPAAAEVESLSDLMSFPHRLLRSPLRVLSKRLSHDRYQDTIRPYWSVVERAGSLPVPARLRRAASLE